MPVCLPLFAASSTLPLTPALLARSKVNHIQIHYNETLALDAQEKSNSLAAADVDPVAVDSEARKNEGENVYWAWGNITGVGYVSAAEWFCAEASRYTAGGIVDDDMNGEWYKWGHWSQVVWPTTTSMGMGAAISASGKVYITFRYWPQGNSIGQGPLP